MKTILMLKYGKKYSSESVNKIVNDTSRKYNYVFITDDPVYLYPIVKTISLTDGI